MRSGPLGTLAAQLGRIFGRAGGSPPSTDATSLQVTGFGSSQASVSGVSDAGLTVSGFSSAGLTVSGVESV